MLSAGKFDTSLLPKSAAGGLVLRFQLLFTGAGCPLHRVWGEGQARGSGSSVIILSHFLKGIRCAVLTTSCHTCCWGRRCAVPNKGFARGPSLCTLWYCALLHVAAITCCTGGGGGVWGMPSPPSYGRDVAGLCSRPYTGCWLAGMVARMHVQWSC
jgi:hypothetical protein